MRTPHSTSSPNRMLLISHCATYLPNISTWIALAKLFKLRHNVFTISSLVAHRLRLSICIWTPKYVKPPLLPPIEKVSPTPRAMARVGNVLNHLPLIGTFVLPRRLCLLTPPFKKICFLLISIALTATPSLILYVALAHMALAPPRATCPFRLCRAEEGHRLRYVRIRYFRRLFERNIYFFLH